MKFIHLSVLSLLIGTVNLDLIKDYSNVLFFILSVCLIVCAFASTEEKETQVKGEMQESDSDGIIRVSH